MKKKSMTLRLFGTLALSIISVTGFALTLVNPNTSVEQMTKDADDIIVGNVVAEEPTVVGRSFETRYKIQVSENFKSGRGRMAPGQTVLMTLPGAALTTPPITQYVSGVPYLAKGEEVLLFLRESNKPDPESEPGRTDAKSVSKLSSSPKIVGWNQGRFGILINPASGKKMVTRINMENYGMINSSMAVREIIDSVAEKRIPLIEQQVVRGADFAHEARLKDPLEITPRDAKSLKVENGLEKGATIKAMRQRGGIPAQYLDDFKAEVQQFSNQ